MRIFLQKRTPSFFCLLIPHLMKKKIEKRNKPILRKWCCRENGQADGKKHRWTAKAEFIGPSCRGGDPKGLYVLYLITTALYTDNFT